MAFRDFRAFMPYESRSFSISAVVRWANCETSVDSAAFDLVVDLPADVVGFSLDVERTGKTEVVDVAAAFGGLPFFGLATPIASSTSESVCPKAVEVAGTVVASVFDGLPRPRLTGSGDLSTTDPPCLSVVGVVFVKVVAEGFVGRAGFLFGAADGPSTSDPLRKPAAEVVDVATIFRGLPGPRLGDCSTSDSLCTSTVEDVAVSTTFRGLPLPRLAGS